MSRTTLGALLLTAAATAGCASPTPPPPNIVEPEIAVDPVSGCRYIKDPTAKPDAPKPCLPDGPFPKVQ